jgi:type IV pilus assembly protein PilC
VPAWRYKARNAEGRVLEGTVDAESEDQARAVLRSRKYTIMEVAKAPTAGFMRRGPKVGTKDVVIFSRQLATMQAAGLPLVSAIGIIADQTPSKGLKTVLTQVRDDVSAGVTTSEALAKHPSVFPPLYVNMVRAGEQGGNLDVILERLSTYLEKAEAMKGKIQSAMTYPIMIAVVASGVVVFLMVKVVPSFKEVFSSFGKELPLPTQILIGLSDFLSVYWWTLILGLGAVFGGFSIAKKVETTAKIIDAILLKLPVMGDLMTKFSVARFSRTLGTLQKSGVNILEALDIVAKTAGNRIIEQAIMKARVSIREGEGISGPLKAQNIFPPMVIQMVNAGEETGKLDEMLIRIADFYDAEVDVAVEGMMKLIEPITMVVLGGIVAVIVLGMYLPMFSMGEMAGG